MSSCVDFMITENLPQPYTLIHILSHLPGFHLKTHMHGFSHLIVVISGELLVVSGENSYHLHAGQVILMPSHVPHELFSEKGYSQIGIDIDDPSEADSHPDVRGIRKALSCACPSGIFVANLINIPCSFDEMYALAHDPNYFNKLKILNYVDSIVVNFIESVSLQENSSTFQRFLKLLSSPDNYNLSLVEICEKLNTSKSQLERLINEKTGFSVIEYCKQLKLKKACALLLDTELPISEISEQLFFNSAAHFSFFFKKRTGVSPSQYRNDSRVLLLSASK